MKRFGFGAVLVGALAVSAAGQDKAVEIKSSRPKAGDRVKVTAEGKTVVKINAAVKGMAESKDETKTKTLVYVDEIDRDAAGGAVSDEAEADVREGPVRGGRQGHDPARRGQDGADREAGDKYTFTVDGKPVDGEAAEDAGRGVRQGRSEGHRGADDAEGAGQAGRHLEDRRGRTGRGARRPTPGRNSTRRSSTATGKLVKAYKKDGRQYGVIEMILEAPVTGLGDKTPLEVKEGTLTVTTTGDGVIDGSTPTGTTKTVTKLGVKGQRRGPRSSSMPT